VQRFDQRQGFLVSALVHLVVLMTLASHPKLGNTPVEDTARLPTTGPRIFLPPKAELRRLFPKPAPPAVRRPAAAPTPLPARPAEHAKDRISVGAPTDAQTKKPLVLRRDESLLGAAKGHPNAVPTAPPPAAGSSTPRPAQQADAGHAPEQTAASGFHLPTGLGDLPRAREGAGQATEPRAPSIASSLVNLDRRLQESGPQGIPTGTTQRIGGLRFDPQGADFTAWLDHFRIEVYNNWMLPKAFELGYHGDVEFEFVVERDGSMSSVQMVKSSGTTALDRAARNALLGSRFLALPSDYGPPRVTMGVIFSYSIGPSGS
jgi:TonB family protein